MDERLKGLKKAMQANTFKHVNFTAKQQQAVHQQLDKALVLTELLSLLGAPKTGTSLTEMLHQKGITAIQLNEGIVYTMLHQAELDSYLTSYWADGNKYYELTKKGMKLMQKQQVPERKRMSLTSRLQEVVINGQ